MPNAKDLGIQSVLLFMYMSPIVNNTEKMRGGIRMTTLLLVLGTLAHNETR